MSFEPATLSLRRLRVYKSTSLQVAAALCFAGATQTKGKRQRAKVGCASLSLRRLRVYKSTRLQVPDALCFAFERVERGIESIEGIESLLKP